MKTETEGKSLLLPVFVREKSDFAKLLIVSGILLKVGHKMFYDT